MEIKIRDIKSEPSQLDKSMSLFTIEFELSDKDNNRTVDFISVTALNLDSLNLMLPDLFKDYFQQKETRESKSQSNLTQNIDKQTFIYNEKLKTIS